MQYPFNNYNANYLCTTKNIRPPTSNYRQKENILPLKRPITVEKVRNDRVNSVYKKPCIINHPLSPSLLYKIEKTHTVNTTLDMKDALEPNVHKEKTNQINEVAYKTFKNIAFPCSFPKSPSTKVITADPLNNSLVGQKNSLCEYNIGRQIGQGAYASVKEAVQKIAGKKFAMKIYDKYRLLDPERKRSVNNEIMILKKLDHRNIVQLHETVDTTKQLCIIMEYANGTSLHSYIKTKPGRIVPEYEAKKIFRQVVSAIDYCHQKGICHRDIKMDNIIVDRNLNVKLIDFGFSTFSGSDKLLKIYCGTPSYMSPEIVTKVPYNGLKADLWSLGILLFVLLGGYYPFKAAADKDLYKKISLAQYASLDRVSPSAMKLISRLLVVEPQKRMTTDKILCDPFLCEEDSRMYKLHAMYGRDVVERLLGMKYTLLDIETKLSDPTTTIYLDYLTIQREKKL